MPVNNVQMGRGAVISHPDLVNIYGCRIGDDTRIGPFVEIQIGADIGARCKIQSHSFICEGVEIGDEVFVGHGVMFVNDLSPRATDDNGALVSAAGWVLSRTTVGFRTSVGSGAIILPVNIGANVLIGAGAVVTRDVPDYAIVVGNPARVVGDTRQRAKKDRNG